MVGRALVAGPRRTSPQIRHAQNERRQTQASPSGVPISTREEVPSSRRTVQPARATPRPLSTDIGMNDPSMGARDGVASSVKDKFRDVFNAFIYIRQQE